MSQPTPVLEYHASTPAQRPPLRNIIASVVSAIVRLALAILMLLAAYEWAWFRGFSFVSASDVIAVCGLATIGAMLLIACSHDIRSAVRMIRGIRLKPAHAQTRVRP